jgi:hypothetical protein
MNLVELIKNQLSSSLINQLSSHIGVSEAATRTAVGAAVPALLSALSGVASSGAGAQKIVSALGHLGGGSVENLVHKLSNQPGSVLEQGTSLLNSLFGGSTVSAIVNALSRFSSVAPGVAQKLLGYLTPMILGAIAGQFAGKSVTTQALSSLLAEQKANIADALPSGFSLSDVPGQAVRSAARGVGAAGSALPRWLLPVLGLAALGLLLWWLVPSTSTPAPEVNVPPVTQAQSPDARPTRVAEATSNLVPDVSKFSTQLTDTFSKLTEVLTGVKDAATAEAALPKLQDLEGKLDVAKTTIKELGAAGQATIRTLVTSAEAKLRTLVDKVLALPGVGEKIKTVVDSIMAKVNGLTTA